MMAAPVAIALTWDSNIVRVKCPYSCPTEVHTHGFTISTSGKPNKRAPHCMPRIDDNGNYVFSQDYRLLFPFEEHPETEGMWWELDVRKKRWRTVSWSIHDPEYWEDGDDAAAQANEAALHTPESPTDVSSVTDITNALSGLTVGTEEDQQGLWFASLCVSNLQEEARTMLANAADATELVNRDIMLDGKPTLLAVVEEGHDGLVDLLLQHGSELEARDRNGNTALLRALHFGRGILAEGLLAAGANLDAINNDGLAIRDEARSSLEKQESYIRIENRMLYPREAPLIRVKVNKGRLRRNIDARGKEIKALQRIIASCNRRQNEKQFLDRLRRICEMYGQEQVESVKRTGELDDQALLMRLLGRVMETPRATKWKTVACLARGTALPWTFAVSGYSTPIPPDGALHRPTWSDRALDLTKIIGHELPIDHRDDKDKPGSYYACHSEKQLLAYFVWNHTTRLFPPGERSLITLRDSEPEELSKLHAEIYVCQPGQDTASVCSDCYNFCQCAVQQLGFRLTLNAIKEGEVVCLNEYLPPSTSSQHQAEL